MATIDFSESVFSSLIFKDYAKQWETIGLTELDKTEQELFSRFLSYLPTIEFDESDLLLVKTSDEGLDKIYGPTIYRQDNKIVLKVGANLYPVTQKGEELTCGQLQGSIDFTGDERQIKIQVNGKETKCMVQDCSVGFVCVAKGSNDQNLYQVAIRTAPETNPIMSNIRVALKQKRNFAQFLAEPATGNGGALKLRDLEIDIPYTLVSSKPFSGNYGDTYLVECEDGTKIWAQGLLLKALDSGKIIPDDFNELTVTSKEKSADGSKTYVKIKLRKYSEGKLPF